MNVAIFLDGVNEFNGPLMFIPGSHKLGVLDAEHDVTTTSYPLWTINHQTIGKLVERGGDDAPKGPAGSMILFRLPGACLDLESLAVEPRERVSLTLCRFEPHPPLQASRLHRASRLHADPLLPDDCLLKHYDVPLPWKDGTPPEELEGVLKAA